MASSLTNRLSREDYRKAKELEELRKTGAAPPELDEDGKMINPHIPQYVSQSPWYLNSNRPGLKHQYLKHFGDKFQKTYNKMGDWYTNKGKFQGPAATKFRKGACENCGAMTHKTKECVERPRRKGAVLTNKNIAKDEIVQELSLDFDGKRDRWNGYNPVQYNQVIEKFRKKEEENRRRRVAKIESKFKDKKTEANKKAKVQRKAERKAKKIQDKKDAKAKRRAEKGEDGSDSDTDSDLDTDTDTDTDTDNDDDDSSGDDAGVKDGGQMIQTRSSSSKFTQNRTTARNLRIREDTPKYLRNLSLSSAYYDPKTRSMRDNPHPEQDPSELMYAGDNFVRKSGDAKHIAALQLFVRENEQKGLGGGGYNEDIHILANPSQAELLHEQFQKKKELLKKSRKTSIMEKYGGSEHMEAPDRSLMLGESEAYIEYSEAGEVIKGQEKLVPKTKYIENRLESNHTQIWGSYWNDGKWGFGCCHSMTRSAYCTGSAGQNAATKLLEQGKEKQKALPPVPTFQASSKDEDEEDGDFASERAAARAKRKQKQLERSGKRSKKQKNDDSSSDSDDQAASKGSKNSKGYNKGGTSMPTQDEMDEYYKSREVNIDHVL